MADTAKIKEHMEVLGSDGQHVGTVDKVEGMKWHIVAKTAGKGDPQLDEALAGLSPEDRAAAQEAARKWLGTK